MGLPKLIAAARTLCYINGNLYGQVFSFNWSSSTPHREINGIDSPITVELAPTRGRCQGNIGLYRVTGDGGTEGVGATFPYSDLPRGQYFTLALVDRATGMYLFRANYCTGEQQQWQVAVKSLMTGSLSFKALTWNNEIVPSQEVAVPGAGGIVP